MQLVKLEQNYRSHGNILDAANALIRQQPGAAGQEPVDERRQGRAGARVRSAVRPRRGGVHRRRRKGAGRRRRALSEIALLYRRNAQSRVLEHALFNAGMPYRVYGGMRFFERAEVKHALAYLRLIAAPDDDGAFLRVVNFPPRGIGARTLEQLQQSRARHGVSLWDTARSAARRRQGGDQPRVVPLADREMRADDGGAAAARSGRARARGFRSHRALQGGEGRPGSARKPRRAGHRCRRLRSRSRDRHRCADADRPGRARIAVTCRRCAGRAQPIR